MLARAPACGSPSSPITTTRCLAASPSTSTDRRASSPARGHEVTVVTGPPPAHAGRSPTGRATRRRRGRSRSSASASACRSTATPRRRSTRSRPASCCSCARLFKRLGVDVVHLHAPYNPSMCAIAPLAIPKGAVGVGDLPLGLRAGRAARRASRPSCGAGSGEARRARRRLRGVHRLARAVLPVRLPHHPERHRRPPLLARRRAAARAARGRQAADPLPRPLRPAQWTADDARRVRAGACASTRDRCGCASSATGRCGNVYRRKLARARGRRRHLGRARRLVAAALLRVGRHPLHALPARLVRHGAARGHEHAGARSWRAASRASSC